MRHDEQYERTFPDEKSPKASSPYRWGMTIDLDKCTGCSACIAACYVENNIPIVGEDETRLRPADGLDPHRPLRRRRRSQGADQVGRPSDPRTTKSSATRTSATRRCSASSAVPRPCEPVCPVIATYHNEDGLNGMIYNRCIGTRYCANNCPYKVRRFNYFDYQITSGRSRCRSDLNPDVTVRGQGVMEKCTFCIQRIQHARQRRRTRATRRSRTAPSRRPASRPARPTRSRSATCATTTARCRRRLRSTEARLPRAPRAQHPARGDLSGQGDPRQGRRVESR